jgi:3-deoxy-D-manno-octulosonic-acid transferase
MILLRISYNLLLLLLTPALLIHYLKGKLILKKYTRPLRERFGIIHLPKREKKALRILIHAVSVGETVAAQPFVLALKEKYPQAEILFSNVTETGHKRAMEIIPANHFLFFPLDFAGAVHNFLQIVNPTHVFILETELWPNFLIACKNRGIPVHFINGRISDKSFERYKAFRIFLRPILKEPFFFMQSKEDEERIKTLGALRAKCCGNMKFDQLCLNLKSPVREQLNHSLPSEEQPVILFGSTHEDETQAIFQMISQWDFHQFPAKFWLAPRHLHKLGTYLKQAKSLNLDYMLKTEYNGQTSTANLLILDTLGELSCTYEHCSIAVVCGSFQPIGGHSILEPALFGKPILYGPYMSNNKEICDSFENANASLPVANYSELKLRLEFLLNNSPLQKTMGDAALKLIQSQSGAVSHILNSIKLSQMETI